MLAQHQRGAQDGAPRRSSWLLGQGKQQQHDGSSSGKEGGNCSQPLDVLQPDLSVRCILDAGAGTGVLSVVLAHM